MRTHALAAELNPLEVSLPFPVRDRLVERFDFQTGRVRIKIHDLLAKSFSGELALIEQIRRLAQ